jgi:two-component system, OmpR family, response regulator ResD
MIILDKKTVLIVDDEKNIRILLKDFLEKEGFSVFEAQDGRQALEVFNEKNEELDLVLLDVMLPELDGWTVCREIRKQSKVPIVMLTARSEDFDEVHGLEIGADDYVKKPIKPSTLIARMNALFRRIEKVESKATMSYNGIEVDDSSHVVKVDGQEVALSPKEYILLVILMENKSKVISREQLLNQVWGYNYYGGLRTVDTHINRLRMKIMSKGDCISTIRGFGYKFEG